MTAADWIIVIVIAVSVLQAAISGFFHEAFGIAGLSPWISAGCVEL